MLAVLQSTVCADSPPPVFLSFTPDASAFELKLDWCRIPRWQFALEADGKVLRSADAEIEMVAENPPHLKLHFGKQNLVWEIKAEYDSIARTVLIDSTIYNKSTMPIALGKAWLFDADDIQGFSSAGDSAVCLPHVCNPIGQVLQKVYRMGDNCPADSSVAVQMFNQDRSGALQAGFVTFQRLNTLVNQEYKPESGRLKLKAWCEFAGWKLAPNAAANSERFSLAVGENPYAQLENWADRAAAFCSPPPRNWGDVPIGWLGWTWVDPFCDDSYENVVLRNAAAIRERMAGFGVNYVWISIGNLPDGQPGAWLDWNFKRFPHGHEYLNDRLMELGFKWGLWCGPFYISSKLPDKVAEFKDALLKNPDGKGFMAASDSWSLGVDNRDSDCKKPLYGLDPTHPKTLSHVAQVFETYRSWGVRYYMIDFLYVGAGNLGPFKHAKFYDPSVVLGPEALQKALKVIRNAAGDDAYLLASTSPTIHCAGIVDGMRTGNDFGEGRPRHPSRDMYPATAYVDTYAGDKGPVHALCNQAAAYYTHRKLYINDSGNVLSVDSPFPLNEARIYATIHAMSGGPTMLGDDISRIDESRLKLIKQTLPRPKNVAVPVDLFSKREQEFPRIFHRKIEKSWGGFDVIAVYNFDRNQALTERIDLKRLGLDDNSQYHLWRFWDNEYVGKVKDAMTASVAPRSVEIYRLTKDDGKPVVIGTDMHMLMGEMEIESCGWDDGKNIFSGKAVRPTGERGNVFVYVPPKLGVRNPSRFHFGKDSRYDCLIMRVPLEFQDQPVSWAVEFEAR